MSTVEMLQAMLREGKITRREFIKKASALGIAAAASPVVFSRSAIAATPKKGGRLRIGLAGGSTTDVLNPELFNDVMVQMTTMGLLRNPLVEQDYQGNAIPELAESWEAAAGAKRWVFKLRKGGEFHNGKTFDADDVIFSIYHHTRPEAKGILKSTLKQIKDIKKDDKYTIVIDLKAGNADFPYILASTRAAMMPNGTTNFSEGIGTGGYKLAEFEPGIRLFAKRNPNYWKTGRAHFDEIDILAIADTTARTTALKTGKVDAINRPDRKTAHLLGKAPGL